LSLEGRSVISSIRDGQLKSRNLKSGVGWNEAIFVTAEMGAKRAEGVMAMQCDSTTMRPVVCQFMGEYV
jgi:hypothetical protein